MNLVDVERQQLIGHLEYQAELKGRAIAWQKPDQQALATRRWVEAITLACQARTAPIHPGVRGRRR